MRSMIGSQVIENISGVLIAGGKSRRMGQDKRFLKVGGTSVFQRTLALLAQTFAETIVVLGEPIDSLSASGCKIVYDLIPNAGSLGGLSTMLQSGQLHVVPVTIATVHPSGAHRLELVGPKQAIVGTDRAAARCVMPESCPR